MVDTSVLVAGVAGLKDPSVPTTPSARFLHEWIEHDTFTWLVTRDILDEYTEVLARLGVRRAVIGRIVNLLRREARSRLGRKVGHRRSVQRRRDFARSFGPLFQREREA